MEENLLGVRISQDDGDDPLDSEEIRMFLSNDVGDRSSYERIEMTSVDRSSLSTITLLEDQLTVIPADSTQNHVSRARRIREPRGHRNAVFRTWLPETLAFACGLGAFAAIITILARFNKYEQPQWPSYINLSTVVALLATLLRSMLMQVIEAGKSNLVWT